MRRERISDIYHDEHYIFRLTSIDFFYGAGVLNAECVPEVGDRPAWLMAYSSPDY
jgi:hypothetical protein